MVGKGVYKENFSTTCRDSYSGEDFKLQREEDNNKFAKFRAMRTSGSAIMDSQKSTDWSRSEGGVGTGENQELSNSQLVAQYPSSNARIESTLSLNRSRSKLLTLPTAPIAVGRSGDRQEQGLNASGLNGERMSLGTDPKNNSFAQRSWLYTDDPALTIKMRGRPTAKRPEGLSLDVGEEYTSGGTFKGWNYGRKAILTGDLNTKTGRERAGLYLDDN